MRFAIFVAALLAASAIAAPISGYEQAAAQERSEPAPQALSSQAGYLGPAELPNLAPLLGPPPAARSSAFRRDEDVRRATLRLRHTPRFQQAQSDAGLSTTNLPGLFSCAANVEISAQNTPLTSALLMRTVIDFGRSTMAVKAQYQRVRPFALHNAMSCTPGAESALRRDGSYPSGHSAIGWGWALVLVELFPSRVDEILQRGRAFGDSRVVCDVHWQSDVEAGRVAATAVTARLHADPAFRADLDDARAELATLRLPTPNVSACAAEAAALYAGP